MLTKHPDQYNPEELEAWVRHLVDEQVSEGPRLDYKATISLDSTSQRLEAAKDISSFANEIGGTIIYGIPEEKRSDETAIPCKPYGIDPIPDLESRLENIYVDSITPRLPEWRIRRVELTEYPGKVVYVVWTPESLIGVHMVQAYSDKRYYRRGQLRSVPMEEYEVRQRYERFRYLRGAVEDFLRSEELSYLGQTLPQDIFVSHYVVCPEILFADRIDFATPDMRKWLKQMENRYILSSYFFNPQVHEEWLPSPYGVRANAKFGIGDLEEIHRNGAISHWQEADVRREDDEGYKLYFGELEGIQSFIRFASLLYKKIQYFAPLQFRIKIENRPKEAFFLYRPKTIFPSRMQFPLSSADGNLCISANIASAHLFDNPKGVLVQIADLLFQQFGIWKADCFDEQLNLKIR